MAKTQKPKKKKLGSYPFITVVLSITLALFVIGVLGSMMFIGNQHIENVESVEVHVYLNNHVTDTDKIKIEKLLSAKPFVKRQERTPMVTFYSRDNMAKRFIEGTNYSLSEEQIMETAGFNPFKACFSIVLDDAFAKRAELNRIKTEIENIAGVWEVDLSTKQQGVIQDLHDNVSLIRTILLVVSGIFLLAILALINNTIKLALFSQRFLIRSMQLVGAKPSFIQWPFLKRSLLHGLIAGLLAAAGVLLLWEYFESNGKEITSIYDSVIIFIVLLALPVTGAILGLFSTLFAVNRYIKMSLDDLY